MKITWLTQGGFLFENNGKRLVVDPYMSNAAEKQAGFKRLVPFPLTLAELRPDVLLCTHDHLDHLDPEAVPRIATADPDCISPRRPMHALRVVRGQHRRPATLYSTIPRRRDGIVENDCRQGV